MDVLEPNLDAVLTGIHPVPTATAHSARRLLMQRTHPLATTTSVKSPAPQLTLQ